MIRMGNMGDMGDMGDMGNQGSGGSAGAGGALPDRSNLPFTTEEARTWDETTNKWDFSGTELGELPHISKPVWRDRDWQPNWAAWLVLDEYAASDWRTITITLWDPMKQDAEITALLREAQDERPDALGEIIRQNASYEDFMVYFLRLLRITPRSHPKTVQLLHVAGLVGILSAMHFKNEPGGGRASRARPSQVCPALMPPVPVPGHPSFPSGHATQAMLMARCAEAALPAVGPLPTLQDAWRPLLQTLAGRIARNREIAGLHFESDTNGGLELAAKAFGKLSNQPASDPDTKFTTLLKAAKMEWQ